MILWFLRLFTQFREIETLCLMQARGAEQERVQLVAQIDSLTEDVGNLEIVNRELITEKTLLEDRLTAALMEKTRLWETAERALDGERYALHTMVNHATQKGGGGVPYGDAHTLPASEVRKIQTPGPVGRTARMLPSELAHRETVRFAKEFIDTLKPEQAA